MKLLIAYDGSACADAALDDLKKAGIPLEGTEALVMAVAEEWLPPPPPSSYEIVQVAREAGSADQLQREYAHLSDAVRYSENLAVTAKTRLEKNFPSWKVNIDSSAGSPAVELIRRAEEWKADLVIVGSHGRTALGRLVLGSVSQKVVAEAKCSVRVARGRIDVDESPVRILIGVDGSPGSELAVRAVASRIWPLGSEARVVIVDDPLTPTAIGYLVPPVKKWIVESNQQDREWVKLVAQSAASDLSGSGLTVESLVREGDPKRILVEDAEAWGADCIFVGSSGFSNRFERFVLGSVSAAVAARSHCSVEVVRDHVTL